MPHIGNIKYHFISDGLSWNDGGGAFGLVPKIIWEKILKPDDLNRVPFALNSLLIQTAGKNILVDTGVGRKFNERLAKMYGIDRSEGDIIDNLAKLGIQPEDIDLVLNTHLHFDHCAGNTYLDEAGDLKATFPNAEYWVQGLEWADAQFPNERTQATYFSENYQPLLASGQLKRLRGDTEVVSGVRLVVTPGHTRAHQSVLIESEGEYGLYVSDLASLSVHFERTAWVTGYDVAPMQTIETKRKWQHWAVETGAKILFLHDSQVQVARLHADSKRFKLEVLPE